MAAITLRALLFYIILMFLMRLMGKRQIGEMQLSEFVTTILLSELAIFPITETDIPIYYGIIPLLCIALSEIIIAIACQKSKRFRIFLNGNPLTLYDNSAFIRENLKKSRMTQEDVEAQVRINGFKTMDEVSTVILERTGKLSVLPKENQTPNQSGD